MNTTITIAEGKVINSFILNDKSGKPVGFANARVEGTYGKGGATKFGFLVFDKDDKEIRYNKGVDGFVKAVKAGKTKSGNDFKLEIFIQDEQFDLVKVKWTEDASIAACIDAEKEIDSLYKAIKSKKGWAWDAFTGKTDKDRKAELSEWLKDEGSAKDIREDYKVVSAPRRPEKTAPRRPAK